MDCYGSLTEKVQRFQCSMCPCSPVMQLLQSPKTSHSFSS